MKGIFFLQSFPDPAERCGIPGARRNFQLSALLPLKKRHTVLVAHVSRFTLNHPSRTARKSGIEAAPFRIDEGKLAASHSTSNQKIICEMNGFLLSARRVRSLPRVAADFPFRSATESCAAVPIAALCLLSICSPPLNEG